MTVTVAVQIQRRLDRYVIPPPLHADEGSETLSGLMAKSVAGFGQDKQGKPLKAWESALFIHRILFSSSL